MRIFWTCSAVILAFWAANAFILKWHGYDLASRGQFGDQFGMINALFSGLAFAGIILSLYLQRRDLKLQRKDLKMQRMEMEMQRDEMKKSRGEFEQQNFNDVFFNLLRQQRELVVNGTASIYKLNEGSLSSRTNTRESGYPLFYKLVGEVERIHGALSLPSYYRWSEEWGSEEAREIANAQRKEQYADTTPKREYVQMTYIYVLYEIPKELWEAAQTMNPVSRARLAYSILFQKYNFVLSAYFRHLYHILIYINEQKSIDLASIDEGIENRKTLENEIEKKYANYVGYLQAQLSPQEMSLCLFNALNFPKAMDLIAEFDLLGNLDEDDLLGIKSNDIPKLRFKSRKNLIQKALDLAQHKGDGGLPALINP